MNHMHLKALVGGTVIWDNHACMPLRTDDLSYLTQLHRVRSAGVNILSLNIAFGKQGKDEALTVLAGFRSWLQDHTDEYLLIGSVKDIETALASERLGICFDIEGMEALDHQVSNVGTFYDLGVRWMLAAYNEPGAGGGGCMASDHGLTMFGRDVIAEMNRVGMVICASHCGYRTAREMIDTSADPVIFSHSNPRALWDHPRNIPDDLMKACAARGGVIGINGFGPFLGNNDASTARYVAHLEYALDLVGEDHLGIALDYVFDQAELDAYMTTNPQIFPPQFYTRGAQMLEPWRLAEVASMLTARGHSTATLRKIFGMNHLRIAKLIWH